MTDLYEEGYKIGIIEGKHKAFQEIMKYLDLNKLQLEKLNILINK